MGETNQRSDVLGGLAFRRYRYGDHDLQQVGVWQPQDTKATQNKSYWIVFIHGGGWRDPRNTYEDFLPSLKAILASDKIPVSSVRGFASLDYRLSPHPNFPQDPASSLPSTELRMAQHPDHIQDVRAALAFLNREFSMGQDYILLGHSAGATLTYQVLMGEAVVAGQEPEQVPLPRVAIGISGIYDLPGLVSRFEGLYRTFVIGAFGSDESVWNRASPAFYSGKFEWPGGKMAMIAWSPEDALIDEAEIDIMTSKMKRDGGPMVVVKDLTGDHEVVWEQGEQIARLVAEAFSYLEK